MPRKHPKVAATPTTAKQPRAVDPLIEDRPLAWRFSACDKGGSWPWTGLDPAEKHREVIDKLREFETRSLGDMKQGGSHPIKLSALCKEARDRLAEIKQDDLDELMSFRLTGTNRVWCVQDRNIMRVLWWDPDHTVCPSKKKHT